MESLPDELLVVILTETCSTDIDVTSKALLHSLRDKTWQDDLMNLYFNVCLVCSKFDRLMKNDVLVPFYIVSMRYNKKKCKTTIFSRFNRVQTISPRYRWPFTYQHDKKIRINDHCKYIVWDQELEKYSDIMIRINMNYIIPIAHTYADILKRKGLPNDYISLLTLRYLATDAVYYNMLSEKIGR